MGSTNNNQGQIINNIKTLQNLEQELYLDLEKLPSSGSNSEAQKEVVYKINNISQSRIALFEQLQSFHSLLHDNVTTEKSELEEQMKFLSIMEKHMDKSKSQLNKNKNLNNNNLRMTEINTYYSQQYNAYNQILKIAIIMCLPLLILAILRQRFLLPSNIVNILGVISLSVGLFFIIPKIIDLYSRNNMVFSEYDSGFNPDHADNPSVTEHSDNELNMLKNSYLTDLDLLEKGDCLGPECCSKGMVYTGDKCELAKPDDTIKESFISGQSTQYPGADLSDPTTMSKNLVVPKNSKYYSV